MSGYAAFWNTLWGNWIVEELVRCGLDTFCISSGSRSTPLTAAAARHEQTITRLINDERASAYFALGYARATQIPAVLICTSGTAAANYLPAIVEASVEQIPLLVLTADRPPEQRQTGANQSIDQNRLFGSHVRWFFDPGCPSPDFPASSLLSCIDQAVHLAKHPLPGPVHLNLPFREAFLLPPGSPEPLDCSTEEGHQNWKQGTLPWIRHIAPLAQANEVVVRELIQQLPAEGVLSLGRVPSELHGSIRNLAEKLKWPVFADIASGFRLGTGVPCRVTFYDQILLDPNFLENHPPRAVLHLGFAPTSKRWLTCWESLPPQSMIWVRESSARLDPSHRFRTCLETSLAPFCDLLIQLLETRKLSEWTRSWLAESAHVEKRMEDFLSGDTVLSEMALANKLTQIIPESHALFLGNSLPVREVDFYGSGSGPSVPLGLNRGASGIDGIIATATGYAAGLRKSITLLIGDLSMVHDLNSLALLKQAQFRLIVVLLNNRGGGIFSFLPVSEHEDIFDSHFATPHTLDFEQAAKMFKIPYFLPLTLDEFEECYFKALNHPGSCLIEIQTVRQENVNIQERWMHFLFEKSPSSANPAELNQDSQ